MKLLKGLKIFLPQTHTDGHRHLSGRPGRIKIDIASRWMVEKLRGLEDRKTGKIAYETGQRESACCAGSKKSNAVCWVM